MSKEDLSKETVLKLPAGLLLIVWDILSNKLAGEPLNREFTEEEKRAIWALEDLCELELSEKGFSERPQNEWEQLIDRATQFVSTLPVEMLD